MNQVEKLLICPGCTNKFSSKREYRGNRVPRVLQCGHSCCDSCIRVLATPAGFLPCPVCKDLTNVEKGVQALPENLYLHGLNSVIGNRHTTIDIEQKVVPASKAGAGDHRSKEKCFECGKLNACYRCDNCVSNYCQVCFRDVHMGSKSLKMHKPKLLQSSSSLDNCSEHNRPYEFYCNDDHQVVCSYCVVMGQHRGHSVITVADWSRESIGDMPEAIENASSVINCLKKTEKKLKNKVGEFQDYFQGVAQEVSSHFMYLYGLLQVQEHRLMSEIKLTSLESTEDLNSLVETVSGSLQEALALVSEGNRIIADSSSTNPAVVLEKLKALANLPCHIYKSTDETTTPSVELDFDPDLVKLIKSHGKLNYRKLVNFTLKNASELPPDYASDEGEDTTDTESVSTASEVSVEQPTSVLTRNESISSLVSETKMSSTEHVVITHVKNPSDFYVQRCSFVQKVKHLHSQMNRAMHSKGEFIELENLEVGDLCLAKYSSDMQWYRCRVVKILANNARDLQTTQVEVFYIDYGNSELTTISNILTLSPKFAKLPAQAVHCSLFNLAPNNEGTWSQEASTYFARITQQKTYRMEVVETGDILKVDLREAGHRSIQNGSSVCDALVFAGYAYYLLEPRHSVAERVTRRKQYYKHEPLVAGQTLNVTFSHIDSPDCSYVQECGSNQDYLENMTSQMQRFYNRSHQDNEIVSCPAIGMVCVAHFSVDEKWHRAKIIAIKGTKVEVIYVDYGNKEVLPSGRLRKINEKFMKLPEQAFPVALAHVQPVSGDGWTNNVRNYLIRLLKNVKVTLKVEHVSNDDVPQVSVFMSGSNGMDVSVNALLVKENLADSSGVLSMVVEVPNLRLLKQRPLSTDVSAQVDDRKNLKLFKPLEAKKQEEQKVVDLVPLPDKDLTPVQVSNIESVSCFYVHLKTDEETGLLTLMKDLQKHCQLADPVDKEWVPNEMCAALHPDTEKWFRGVIKAVGDLIDVYSIDFGYTVQVDPTYVQVLEDDFKEQKPFAIQCHLADISPAGGNSNWSKTALDFFKSELASHETTYLRKMGEEENCSLPVDILMEYGIPVGILEPLRKEYKSMRESLRNKGYGLFPKRSSRQKELKPVDKSSGSDVTSNDEGLRKAPIKVAVENKLKKEDPSLNGDEQKHVNSAESVLKVVDPCSENKPDAANGTHLLITEIEQVVEINKEESKYEKHSEEKPTKKVLEQELKNSCQSPSLLPIPASESIMQSWADIMETGNSMEETTCKEEPIIVGDHCEDSEKNDNIMPFDPRDNEEDSEEYEDIEDDYEDEDAPVIVECSSVFKWKPAIFPDKTEMPVMPLHVNETMGFYVRILDETVSKIREMNDALSKKYNDLPSKTKPVFSVGQACIAKYDYDNKWYRGEVLGIDESSIKVRFVDYGTIEAVPPSQIHTDLLFTEVPILCHLVYLYNIRSTSSDGLWPIEVLDMVHFKTVEKTFTMTVHEFPKDGNCAEVSLSLTTGNLDLRTVLLAWNVAEVVQQPEEDTKDGSYLSFSVPDEGLFPVVITNLIQVDLVCVQFSKVPSTTTEKEEEINTVISDFLSMTEDLQKSADDFDEITDPYENMPCCGKFTADDNWYRGLIISLDGDKVKILYVDYGNTESIPLSRVRKLPETFFDVPMQAHVFKLHGLKPKGDESKVIKALGKILFDNSELIYARIKVPGDPTEVDLLDPNLDLIYQPLEEEELITVERAA